MSARVPLCAPGRQEHALCGYAADAFESGDADRPIVFAGPGETVTCQECRAAIDWVRETFSKYRVKSH